MRNWAEMTYWQVLLRSCNLLIARFNNSMAGSDTTATSLTFILYYLIKDRNAWDRISKEIRSKYKLPTEITYFSTSSIPFLDAVIHEGNPALTLLIYIGIRLRPAVPPNLPREVPPEGMMIAGRFIPGRVHIPHTPLT